MDDEEFWGIVRQCRAKELHEQLLAANNILDAAETRHEQESILKVVHIFVDAFMRTEYGVEEAVWF